MTIDADDEILQDFLIEAGEILERLNEELVELEQRPDDVDMLNAVFRGFHTIKGVAGFVEMEHIKELAHKAENLLSMVRKGDKALSGDAMDLAFASVEHIMRNVNGGHMLRYLHANGASLFFVAVYAHIFRGLFDF